MKLTSLTFYSLLMLFLLYSCGKTNEVTISGQLSGVEDGVVLSLFGMDDGGIIKPFVSDTVKGGHFSFTYTDSVPGVKQIGLIPNGEGFPSSYLTFWVEPGVNVEISGNDKLLKTWDIKSNIPEQQEQNKYMADNIEYLRQTQIFTKDAHALFDIIRKSPEKRAELRSQIDDLNDKSDSIEAIISRNELNRMKENLTYSPYWMDLLYRHSFSLRYREDYPHKEELLTLYSQLPEDKKNDKTGKLIAINLFPPTVVKEGDEMADSDLYDVEGNLHHLADYKGKYILLDFWSAGCGPCIMAIPEMREIAEAYKDKLTIVSISSDPEEIWKEVSKEKNLTWVNLNDFQGNNGIVYRYGVNAIPNYVMVSPDGTILKNWSGYGEGSLKEKMKELIK